MALRFIAPDGKPWVLDSTDPADIQNMTSKGFRLVTEEAPVTLGEQLQGFGTDVADTLKAGARGVLSGLSAGISDWGEATLLKGGTQGADPRYDAALKRQLEENKQLEADNPLAYGAGNIAGAVVSPLNKVQTGITGALKGGSLLSRVGAEVVGGGAVGALYGAGNSLSDAVLGDQEITAQKLIAGGGLGMLLGGAAGGVGGLLDEGITAVTKKLGGKLDKAEEKLEEFANNRWLKASGTTAGKLGKVPPEIRDDVAQVLRENLRPMGAGLSDSSAVVAAQRDALADSMLSRAGIQPLEGLKTAATRDKALEALDEIVEKTLPRQKAVYEAAAEKGAVVDLGDLMARVNKEADALSPLQREEIAPLLKKISGAVDEYATKGATGFKALNELRADLQKMAKWKLGEEAFGADLKRQFSGIVRDELDTQLARQVGSDLSKEFLESKKILGAVAEAQRALRPEKATGADALEAIFSKIPQSADELKRLAVLNAADDLLKSGVERKLGNLPLSLTDQLTGMTGAAMHGNVAGLATGLGSAFAHKFVRERGSAILASTADAIRKSPKLMAVAKAFGEGLPAKMAVLGTYGPRLVNAFQISPANALAEHMTLAQTDPEYQAVAQAAGFAPESPGQMAFSMGKAEALAGLAEKKQAYEKDISDGVDSVFKGKAPKPQTKVPDVPKKIEEFRRLKADPQALLDTVMPNLGRMSDVAPGIASAMVATAQTAVEYLSKLAEEPTIGGAMGPKWETTGAERFRFEQALRVVENPMSVLQLAASGMLTPEEMTDLRAVYPKLAEDISNKMLGQIAQRKGNVPYQARLMASILTGMDIDGTTTPEAIMANQDAIQAASQKEKEAPVKQGGKGLESLSIAARSQTNQQQLQSREGEA